MDDQHMPPLQSLQIIEGMINKAKNRFNENGFLYLLWGWVIFFTSVAHFILLKFTKFKNTELVWLSCGGAIIIQVIYLWKQMDKKSVKTYSDEMIDYIWTCFGLSMLALTFITHKNLNWIDVYPIILLLYSIPTFLSGAVMRFSPLKVGGGICMALSLPAAQLKNEYILLILSIAVISAWIVPGYILKAKYKKENK